MARAQTICSRCRRPLQWQDHLHQDIARPSRQFSCGKHACHQGWSQTSETAKHQGFVFDYFVAYIRVASFLLRRRCDVEESSGMDANGRVGRNLWSELLCGGSDQHAYIAVREGRC